MKTTLFYITPDKFSAHHIRRELSHKSSLLGTQVGTWPELLELARTSYCLPEPEDNWQDKLQSTISKVGKAFWRKSLVADPEATTIIITKALNDLLWGIVPEKKITAKIRKQLSERGNKQIIDLLSLHKKMGEVLPAELALVQELMAVNHNQAIRHIKVYYDPEISSLNVWQTALVDRLNKHAGKSDRANNDGRFAELISWLPSSKGKSGLCHLQRNLFSPAHTKQKSHHGLQWLTCRDYRQEVEIAVGMVQNIMADTGCFASEIGLLLPESSTYCQSVEELFSMAGIPLSGLTTIINSRDLARELLYYFLLCRQAVNPPPMLQASLFGSPLLPWKDQACEISQAIMDGEWMSEIVKMLPESQQGTARFLAGKASESPVKLAKAFRGLLAILSKGEGHDKHRQIGLALIHDLLAIITQDEDEIDWQTMLQTCRPQLMSEKEVGEINMEGIRIIHPNREPWQKVEHLIVLGFNEGNYPNSPGVLPIIPESDRLVLDKSGISLPTRSGLLQEYRQRFHRQLCSAGKSITFFIPQMDSMGDRLQPSSTLGFMAQLFDDVEASDLLLDLGQPNDRKQVKHLVLATEQSPTPPLLLHSDDLEIDDNLLTKRKDSDGNTAPESPSGLETMMVSPLAWVFKRYHIDSHEWGAEGLDVMTMGSIAHDIFEKLFSHNNPLPQRGRIKAKVKSLFMQITKENYPFLARDEYQVECQQMIRQYGEAAEDWWDFLKNNRLEILGEETWLAGRFNHHPIRGKADLICRAPNQSLLVIDYKTAKSTGRTKIMEHGYDHQTSLYCQMLESDQLPDKIPLKLKNHLTKEPKIGALYYTLRDQTVLGNKQTDFLDDATIIENNISVNGLARIREHMKDLRHGKVVLNTVGAEEWFKDEAGLTPYALGNSPLISLFMKEAE